VHLGANADGDAVLDQVLLDVGSESGVDDRHELVELLEHGHLQQPAGG
jgi:hypothetical protein